MLKLLSLNIEGDNHLDLVTSFIRSENPDLVCLNEVFEIDVPVLKHIFNFDGFYVAAQTIINENKFRLNPRGNIGTLILSKTPFLSTRVDYYDGDPDHLPELTSENGNAANRFIVWVEVGKEGQNFLIASTHFTVTRGGVVSDLQRENVAKMLSLLKRQKNFVLCGDFNAPRGREIFAHIAAEYEDNIPVGIKTTLDRNLHRDGTTEAFPEFVVDGLFTTSGIVAHEVRVECGVSDHCAILADITLKG